MSTNKLEEKANIQIHRLSEGLALRMLKFFMRSKVKKAFKVVEDDPEFKAALDDFNYHGERLQDMLHDYEKQYGKDAFSKSARNRDTRFAKYRKRRRR